MSIEVMKQALEALCELEQDMFHPAKVFKHKPTITALRTAIEQAEKQELEEMRNGAEMPEEPDGLDELETRNYIATLRDLLKRKSAEAQELSADKLFAEVMLKDCNSFATRQRDRAEATEAKLAAIEQAEKQEPVAWDDLLGAVARGWGHSKNAHKEMDSDLAIAIAEEVKSLLKEKNT